MDLNNKVLLIGTENTSGMLPYASGITNALESKNIFALLVSNNTSQYENLVNSKNENYYFFTSPKSKIQRVFFRLFPVKLFRSINEICVKNNISTIHLLTQDTILIPFLFIFLKRFDIYYTVHDLRKHDISYNSLYHWLVSNLLFFIPVNIYIKNINNLVTNSKSQYNELIKRYDNKKVFYHPFPSLINEKIISGRSEVPELKNENNYILFFGRFEEYKGIKNLYNSYLDNSELHINKLVIAGSGNINFKRNQSKENGNIVIINRFIDDLELNDLFNRSAIIVYPYISATQSGVLSLALFYNKPLVVSDIPFFKELIENDITGTFFQSGNSKSLYLAIKKNHDSKYVNHIISNQPKIYQECYSTSLLKSSIIKIYENK